jgi:hypothetical protein
MIDSNDEDAPQKHLNHKKYHKHEKIKCDSEVDGAAVTIGPDVAAWCTMPILVRGTGKSTMPSAIRWVFLC